VTRRDGLGRAVAVVCRPPGGGPATQSRVRLGVRRRRRDGAKAGRLGPGPAAWQQRVGKARPGARQPLTQRLPALSPAGAALRLGESG
jgi:hypothetical protein